MELMTERLVLREFVTEDFEAVHAYASNKENVRYMIWGPNSEEDTRDFILFCMERGRENPRLKYDWAVTLKDGDGPGKLIGGCGIYLDESRRTGELGWILHRDYWKQGIMAEAARTMIDYGFTVLNLHRIYSACNGENYGSYRVMEKCGMRKEAHFIQSRYGRVGDRHSWYDECHYGILQDEWRVRR